VTLTDSELTFHPSVPTLLFAGGLFLATAVFSFLIWKRSHYSGACGALELLRLLIVALVGATLNQPEWRKVFTPEEIPVLALLVDASGSMDTEDVAPEDGSLENLRSRRDTVDQLLEDPGWETLAEDFEIVVRRFDAPPADGTDIATALESLLSEQPGLRGAVLFSDGDWNLGEPPSRAATNYRMRDIPVHAVPVGSEYRLPDLEVVSFDAPTFGIVGKPLRLPYTIASSLARSHQATVEMRSDDGEVLATTVPIPAMGRVQETFLWTPQSEGDFDLTLSVLPAEEERDLDNNQITAPISIRREELRVLVIDSYPRWEYRYLRNALERDPGVEVATLLFHPDVEARGQGRGYLADFPESELLSTFDVVILGDVGLGPDQLTLPQIEALRNHVSAQAAGLVLIPGFRGFQLSLVETPLDDLFPVVLDPAQPRGWGSQTPGQFELTELGTRSLLTRLEDNENANFAVWSSLPGFQWYAGVLRSRAGSEVLATHSSDSNRHGRIPLIATRTYGAGKILFMGTDGAWRWRKGVEDKYHYRFWGQVARWMAYQRSMASDGLMRLFYSPDRPATGGTLTLNANVMSVGGEPLQNATVTVQITAPSGRVESIRLAPGGEDQWGLFNGAFTPTEPGEHHLTLLCVENGGRLDLTLNVQGSAREQTGLPARPEVLEEIANLTRGELFRTPDIGAIQARLAALPEPDPIERRERLWANPWWIGTLVLLLGLFWVGRKSIGQV